MNKIPAVACRGIHFYTQPKGERERETDDDGNGWTEYKGKKQGQEELGHIISVCVCVCVCVEVCICILVLVDLCALYVGVLNIGSDVDISDSKRHQNKAAKERKERGGNI